MVGAVALSSQVDDRRGNESCDLVSLEGGGGGSGSTAAPVGNKSLLISDHTRESHVPQCSSHSLVKQKQPGTGEEL